MLELGIHSKKLHESIVPIINKTKIIPNYINVGGGFPTIYPDLIPQSLNNYFDEINYGSDSKISW